MFIVDKTLTGNTFIVSVTERLESTPSVLSMDIHSSYSNLNYEVILPENVSEHKFRYDKFIVPGDVFGSYEPGLYNYTIKADGVPVKQGMLKVIDPSTDSGYITPDNQDTDDDFLIYNPE